MGAASSLALLPSAIPSRPSLPWKRSSASSSRSASLPHLPNVFLVDERILFAMPTSYSAPARLYALLLKLRPLQPGTLMPFSGELVHGAFLHWLENAAPDVAAWLHEGNNRRFFTCSSLQFPFPAQRLCEAQRANVHLPLDPEKTYCVRITLLLGELLPLFHEALTHFNAERIEEKKPHFMQVGKRL